MTRAPGAVAEWDRFTDDLAMCLADLDEDEFLIVSYKKANYFVQFCGQGKFGMRSEAVSNVFIEPLDAALTVEAYAHMDGLGWNRATNPPPEYRGENEPSEGSPNFYLDVASPVDYGALAALAVCTLREVYGVGHPGELEYKAFTQEGVPIRFPSLRVRRADR